MPESTPTQRCLQNKVIRAYMCRRGGGLTWNMASKMATNMLEALFRSSSNELIGLASMPTRFSRVLMLAWQIGRQQQ